MTLSTVSSPAIAKACVGEKWLGLCSDRMGVIAGSRALGVSLRELGRRRTRTAMWWLLACGCLLPIACARAVPTARRHDVSRSTAGTGQAAGVPDTRQDLSRSASARCRLMLLGWLSLSVVQRRGCRSAWAARGCVRRDATRHGMTGKRRDAPRQDRTGQHGVARRGAA